LRILVFAVLVVGALGISELEATPVAYGFNSPENSIFALRDNPLTPLPIGTATFDAGLSTFTNFQVISPEVTFDFLAYYHPETASNGGRPAYGFVPEAALDILIQKCDALPYWGQ